MVTKSQENYKITKFLLDHVMEDHVKPVLWENPDEIIFHIGTNDLPSGKGNKDIAEAIINLAMSENTVTRCFDFWYYCEKR